MEEDALISSMKKLQERFEDDPRKNSLKESWYYKISHQTDSNQDVILNIEPEKKRTPLDLTRNDYDLAKDIDLEQLTDFIKQPEQVQLAFNFKMEESPRFFAPDPDSYKDQDIWYIGDIHGDFFALQTILPYIEAHSQKPIFVFLGDCFDRNPYGLEVLKIVLDLIRRKPGQVFWLAGNHDIALNWSDLEENFTSEVHPAEFSQWLNDHPEYQDFAKALISFIHKLPFALLLLKEGVFVSHAGIPSSDFDHHVWDGVESPSDLEAKEMEHAFEWNRLYSKMRSRCSEEFSWDELQDFCKIISKLYHTEIKYFLRGHDHCGPSRHEHAEFKDDWRKNASYPDISVLTFTSMFLVSEGEKTSMRFKQGIPEIPTAAPCTQSTPTVVHFKTGMAKPEVFSFALPKNSTKTFYSERNI